VAAVDGDTGHISFFFFKKKREKEKEVNYLLLANGKNSK
jgi:hypothetical protein